MDYRKINKKAVVLDFDGTICRLFANYDLSKVSKKLQETLLEYNVQFNCEEDCFKVFDVISNQLSKNERNHALIVANDIIQAAECDAIDSAPKILGIHEFIQYCYDHDIQLGIATNNSEACIHRFLEKNALDMNIPIYGRDVLCLEHLKPNPWVLNHVIKDLNVCKEDVLFIGDNPTDYECAIAADVDFIAIVTTEKKKKRFEPLTSKCFIIESYYELLD